MTLKQITFERKEGARYLVYFFADCAEDNPLFRTLSY